VIYSKYRVYRIPTAKFDSLNEALRVKFGCSFKPLDTRGIPQPGKPINGGINGERMNAPYRPGFYWKDVTLTVMIPDALSMGSNPAYAQESAFWSTLEEAIKQCGGNRVSDGTGVPPGVPPEVLH